MTVSRESEAPAPVASVASETPPAASVRQARAKRRHPVISALTIVAIPGIFLTAGLPAYAFAPGESPVTQGTSASAPAQGVTVAASAAKVTVARDGFSATTPEELAAKKAAAEAAAEAAAAQEAAEQAAELASSSEGAWSVYGVRAEGDDYPWPYETPDFAGGGLSPLGYYYRECVDFVAWRLNRDAGSTGSPWRFTWSNLTPGGGDASAWASAWQNHGWATSDTPVVGAVAWFDYNHVAYVQSVNDDGTVSLEEYNWGGSHTYNTRTIPAGDVNLFLYPPA
ncbi:CHAP domain-containing protein [Cryobacterium tepidiphilum]|uniref:CHAP domain-containing protein n=1 Tax=Cryobacterium tepidiphilum TaxID=2486026 RepID=A0A3M8KWF7_9MICO|nr:CHAP domain-containing protein [Cryobacterium tepidiphilum]RNE56989.1 CHAP domain-containing protein [Cryobacterium tepidiphilum]